MDSTYVVLTQHADGTLFAELVTATSPENAVELRQPADFGDFTIAGVSRKPLTPGYGVATICTDEFAGQPA
jgi:hypothetical protein